MALLGTRFQPPQDILGQLDRKDQQVLLDRWEQLDRKDQLVPLVLLDQCQRFLMVVYSRRNKYVNKG
jgi:hypothetical protein